MLCSDNFWFACLMPDIGNSRNDHHKWNKRKNWSRCIHVLFVYCVAKVSSQVHALAEKVFRKYQQISANFSNCNGVYFQKNIISRTGECVLKKNFPSIVFLYCDINQFKTLKISSPFIDQERFLIFSFSIHWSGEIFSFSLTFFNEECTCTA